DRIAVLDQDADDLAGDLRLDLVHHLHRFDDAERVADGHLRADLDEGLRPGTRARVERADHRCRALLALRRGLGRGLGLLLGRLCRLRRVVLGRGREAHHARVRIAADPHRLLALRNLDLGDAGFLEQLDQLLDLAYIHYFPPRAR